MSKKRPSPERIRNAIIASGCHYASAARALGIGTDSFRAYVAQYRADGHHFPGSKAIGVNNQAYEPTPAEIREACQEIQKGWTAEDFVRRAKWAVTSLDFYVDFDDRTEVIW